MPTQYRRHQLPAPGSPITIEVHGRAGERLVIVGTYDGAPQTAAGEAQRIRIVDAVAKPG